ncbi:hypothetical protein ACP4OV_016647 [Aristida adscensionis]
MVAMLAVVNDACAALALPHPEPYPAPPQIHDIVGCGAARRRGAWWSALWYGVAPARTRATPGTSSPGTLSSTSIDLWRPQGYGGVAVTLVTGQRGYDVS